MRSLQLPSQMQQSPHGSSHGSAGSGGQGDKMGLWMRVQSRGQQPQQAVRDSGGFVARRMGSCEVPSGDEAIP